jgi:hypothetical protein
MLQREVFDQQTIEAAWSTSTPRSSIKLPIADRIGYIPTDTPRDHVTFKMAA